MSNSHGPIKSHRDLSVWWRAIDLVEECYQCSRALPREEKYGLVSQLQRAAVSVSANIAEGHGRFERADFMQFLSFANGSLCEVDSHLEVCLRLKYARPEIIRRTIETGNEVGRMLSGLRRSVARRRAH